MENYEINYWIIAVTVGLIMFIIGLLIGKGFLKSSNEIRLVSTEERHKRLHLSKQGATTSHAGYNIKKSKIYEEGQTSLSYRLVSWDSGKNWYAIDYNFNQETFKIIGEAEEIFPGLLKHLKSWEDLTKYVETNGAITFGGDRAANDKLALENAGFTVKKKE